jgi:archaellum component FlaC
MILSKIKKYVCEWLKIDVRFKEVGDQFKEVKDRLEEVEDRLKEGEDRLRKIEIRLKKVKIFYEPTMLTENQITKIETWHDQLLGILRKLDAEVDLVRKLKERGAK